MTDFRNYVAVTAAYWAFTLTDGALRMLVLLHFHRLGYTPLDLAFLFLLYEAMGIATNFIGGWIGALFGLRITLFAGLSIQIVALGLLSAFNPEWTMAFSVVYVMAAQALSGVAKDLTKMSSKSAVKLVVNENAEGLLFKWVALLTGSKNALKGLGFLAGGVLLEEVGFQASLWSMAGMLGVILILAVTSIKSDMGKSKRVGRRDLFAKTREINILSAARIFLFASRDVWFVVGVPIFLYSSLDWNFDQVGAFMAIWIVGYGIIQAVVPKFLKQANNADAGARAVRNWGFGLAFLPLLLALGLQETGSAELLIGGLLFFGIVFAVNSSLHSYLILAYSDHDKIALNVGFYYMANAIGRLGGTLLSGLVYQMAGLKACLWVSSGMLFVAATLTVFLSSTSKSEN